MRKKNNILKSTATVGSLTGLSRLLGLIREILMAHIFGTTLIKSAFDVAFRIPNLFRAIFGEGALSAAFIPVYADRLEKSGNEDANDFAARILTLLATALIFLVLAIIGITQIAQHFGWGGEKWASIYPLLKILMPYSFFLCMVALAMGILNSHGRFWVPAFTPGILNIVWIGALLAVLVFGSTYSLDKKIKIVAFGVLGSGALQMLFQIPHLSSIGFTPRLSFSWNDDYVKKFLRLMAPGFIGMGVQQINVFISSCLALTIGVWAPAALTYADRLIYLPLGIFATALGSVLLPTFSQQAAQNNNDEMAKTLNSSLQNISFVMLPMAALLCALALPITGWIFQWRGGLFDRDSNILTARAVAAYAPGLLVFSLHKVIAPAFYAMKDTRTPVVTGLIAVVINLTLNILSILFMPEGYQHAGMAGANVLAVLANCTMLIVLLRKRSKKMTDAHTLRNILAMLACAVAGGWVAFVSHQAIITSFSNSGKFLALTALLTGTVTGLAAYLVLCFVVCRKEMRNIIQVLSRRNNEGIN